jgi:hypothetical protein
MRTHQHLEIEAVTACLSNQPAGLDDVDLPLYGSSIQPAVPSPPPRQRRSLRRIGYVLAAVIAITSLASIVATSRHDDQQHDQPAVLASGCRDFIATVAEAFGTDPGTWVLGVLDSGGGLGQTLDDAIHDRLVGVRGSLLQTQYTDPRLEADLRTLDALIQRSLSTPCSKPLDDVTPALPSR